MRHWPEIRALLNRFCGYDLKDNEALLLNVGGTAYFIADIGLRMLTPRELYNAMGFPPDYIIDRDYTGRAYGKSKQVAHCGNAVCPASAADERCLHSAAGCVMRRCKHLHWLPPDKEKARKLKTASAVLGNTAEAKANRVKETSLQRLLYHVGSILLDCNMVVERVNILLINYEQNCICCGRNK